MDPWEQSQTVDPEVRAYVQSLVNAVGGRSTYDDTYAIGDDAPAAVNDLVRWLRLYDEKLHRWDVKRCMAQANLFKGDLLEILALWPEDQTDNKVKSRLALGCLQLMVPLTWPLTDDKVDEQFTVNNARHLPFLQLAQAGYKRAILTCEYAKILRTVVRIGLPSMAQPRSERSKRDRGIVKLMLYLFRNVASITQPQHLPSQGDENDISRSATIDDFHDQDIFNVLLTIGSGAGDEFREENAVLLEILFHLLKGVDARKLFMKKEQVEHEETNELQTLMTKEKAMLSGYKKHAPTRHNRFGTMIWIKRDDEKMSTLTGQNSITDESNILKQMDSNKKWNRPQYRGKLTKEFNEESDFSMRIDLSESARGHLRAFVEDILDSSFNPLFSCLRKDIERDDTKIQASLHHRQFFYLIHWFLNAESARRDQNHAKNFRGNDQRAQNGTYENTFTHIAAVLDQETFVLLNRHMQSAFDRKEWQELQATLLCFTQILFTVQSMAESKDEEDQEIAENIQSRIFYEETVHDRIVQILRGYTNQGFAYLDTVTECVHVFVRMLEQYSKQNVDLMIRSKRRSRKKQTQDTGAAADEEADAEDTRDAHLTVSDRKFDFARFSAKFLSQGCVETFLAILHFYKDLTPAQLKRCHRYLYRLAFKHELAVFLFRVDILQLLYRMIKGPDCLSSEAEGYSEWQQLVQAIFRKCIKWLERTSEGEGWKEVAMIEMLFSKIPNTLFYLQNGYERVVERRPPRPPAELEIKKGIEEGQRVGIAVGLMIDKSKADAVSWVKKEIERAMEERSAWEQGQAALQASVAEQEDEEALRLISAPSIFLMPDSDERKADLFKDKHLRLLLTTLGCQRLGVAEDVDASWIIPSDLTSAQLKEALNAIGKAEFDPPTFEDDKTAEDMVRNKSATREGANDYSKSDSDGEDSGGDINEAMFLPNLREKRKEGAEEPKRKRLSRRTRDELTQKEIDERAAERRRKERERNSKIKSALFVTAEDDLTDDEADAEFFRLEEERRNKVAGAIRNQLIKEMEQRDRNESSDGATKGKRRGKKRSSTSKQNGRPNKKQKAPIDADSETDNDNDNNINADTHYPNSQRKRRRDRPQALSDSAEEDDNDSSPSSAENNDDSDGIELTQNRVDVDEEMPDTPSTSPHLVVDDGRKISENDDGAVLREVSENMVPSLSSRWKTGRNQGEGDAVVGGDEEEDDPVGLKTMGARGRARRAGFVLDDSDDE